MSRQLGNPITFCTGWSKILIVFWVPLCEDCLMNKLRVLIIEDHALIAMLLAELLAEMGYEICGSTATEAEGVSAAIQDRPDLMIVDVGLGQGNGISAVEEIFRSASIPHVFISGDEQSVLRRRPGAIVLRKPFRKAELARAINMAVAAAPH
jgi:DNA-binding NarL/FixJ family response regulator